MNVSDDSTDEELPLSEEQFRYHNGKSQGLTLYKLVSKNFWRTGITIELQLVEHTKHMIIEIIPRVLTKTKDETRIYLSMTALFLNLNQEIARHSTQPICDEATTRSPQVTRGGITAHDFHFRPSEVREKIVHYILDRLVIPIKGDMRIWLNNLDSDTTCDVVCEKPPTLKPYEIKAAVSTEKDANSWASTLRIMDPDWAQQHFPLDGNKTALMFKNFSSDVSDEGVIDTPKISSPGMQQWRWLLRRFVLISEISKMKKRLETLVPTTSPSTSSGKPLVIDARTMCANSSRYSAVLQRLTSPSPRADQTDDCSPGCGASTPMRCSKRASGKRGTHCSTLRTLHSVSIDCMNNEQRGEGMILPQILTSRDIIFGDCKSNPGPEVDKIASRSCDDCGQGLKRFSAIGAPLKSGSSSKKTVMSDRRSTMLNTKTRGTLLSEEASMSGKRGNFSSSITSPSASVRALTSLPRSQPLAAVSSKMISPIKKKVLKTITADELTTVLTDEKPVLDIRFLMERSPDVKPLTSITVTSSSTGIVHKKSPSLRPLARQASDVHKFSPKKLSPAPEIPRSAILMAHLRSGMSLSRLFSTKLKVSNDSEEVECATSSETIGRDFVEVVSAEEDSKSVRMWSDDASFSRDMGDCLFHGSLE